MTNNMFVLKKKRYKFHVELNLEELTEVSFSKGVLLAKVRQLDGGNFVDLSERREVQNHRVRYNAKFGFPCKMNANANSGILETCKCRISIRMEEKGGKQFRKLGFADVNLAEYAGAGPSTQRYILQPYDQSHRLDNSILKVSLNITLKEGDTIFQRPLTRHQPIELPGEKETKTAQKLQEEQQQQQQQLEQQPIVEVEATTPTSSSSATLASSSSTVNQNRLSTASTPTTGDLVVPPGFILGGPVTVVKDESVDPNSHTRNSSSTSQASAGYSSQNSQVTAGHSRQSSSGGESASTHARNPSQGSSDTGFHGGSLEKEKRRKQPRLDEGRIDAEAVINELMEGVELEKEVHEETETSGLQLYVSADGSVTFDKRNSVKPVVINRPK